MWFSGTILATLFSATILGPEAGVRAGGRGGTVLSSGCSLHLSDYNILEIFGMIIIWESSVNNIIILQKVALLA